MDHMIQMEQHLAKTTETLLAATKQALQYHQSLDQTYVNGHKQTNHLSQQIRDYNIAMSEAAGKAFGNN